MASLEVKKNNFGKRAIGDRLHDGVAQTASNGGSGINSGMSAIELPT